jgi:hypothetical protein
MREMAGVYSFRETRADEVTSVLHREQRSIAMMGGPGMMGNPGMSTMMLWMPIGMLVGVVLLVGVIWLVMRWLNQRDVPPMPSLSQPQESYEQGYRSRQPFPATSQESEWRSQDPQPKQEYDQPQLELEYPFIRE